MAAEYMLNDNLIFRAISYKINPVRINSIFTWGWMVPGCAPGLQNQSRGSAPVLGGFDSHALQPVIARLSRLAIFLHIY